ncbi:MAG: VOC family protein [Actinomycetota bacterium]|nr:VOC family protein [Actinomycetota bacterium]
MTGIARFGLVALDCPQPLALAKFYAAITGWDVRGEPGDDDDWVQLVSPLGATIAFQLAPGHQPPEWPSDEHPQQLHLDFDVDDLQAGEDAILALGATKAPVQQGGDSFRVYLDPSGHPLCLVHDG